MRYTIHVQEGDEPSVFLHSSEHLERLKANKATLSRWIFEMGFQPKNFPQVKFIIFADNQLVFTKNLVGVGSRGWNQPTF